MSELIQIDPDNLPDLENMLADIKVRDIPDNELAYRLNCTQVQAGRMLDYGIQNERITLKIGVKLIALHKELGL